jgi:hypothetical protein
VGGNGGYDGLEIGVVGFKVGGNGGERVQVWWRVYATLIYDMLRCLLSTVEKFLEIPFTMQLITLENRADCNWIWLRLVSRVDFQSFTYQAQKV